MPRAKSSFLGDFQTFLTFSILMLMKAVKNIPIFFSSFGVQYILIKTGVGGHCHMYKVLINGVKICKISAGRNWCAQTFLRPFILIKTGGRGVDEFHLYWGDNIVSLSLGGTFLQVQNTNNCFKSSNLITQLQISSHQ